MAAFRDLNPLKVTKRASRSQYSDLPIHEAPRRRDIDEEKYESEYSDDDSEYSSYPPSPERTSRDTSDSYSPTRPILHKRSVAASKRSSRSPAYYRIPNRIIRCLCFSLILTLIVLILSLIRMSIVSSRRVEVGDLGERPPPPPAPWESFRFLSRYYGGIRTIVPQSENRPEYPLLEDEILDSNGTAPEETMPAIRDAPTSLPFEAYNGENAADYLPRKECFLDERSTIRIPHLQYYAGRPQGFPDHVMGSYELLGMSENMCFDRYGRLGPYGYGYSLRTGGTGTGNSGDANGSEAVWRSESGESNWNKVDYRAVDWAAAQQRCYQANSRRFGSVAQLQKPVNTFSVLDEAAEVQRRDSTDSNETEISTVKYLPRTAVVIRTWDDFDYQEEDIMHLRAMIAELSLGSGGEYDVHLLVQVKDEGKNPIWADQETYQRHLNESVPEEFRGIATFWSVTQMLMLYQGIFDNYARGPELPVHGSYRGLQMAMQWFAQEHPEYDFFWHWEVDIRYSGHYYDLFSRIDSWTTEQPRKGLWERNARFYVPAVHGSWEDFKHMARVQTDMGTDGPSNMWSGISGTKGVPERPKGDKSIWGPERPQDENDWFEIENDPKPPTSYDKDKYVWGVGEAADLITFNPLFDPDGTTWLLANDITGYNASEGLPPRRAAIVSSARMSRQLLNTMHRETTFKKHHAFSEMWAPTTALHHGYKAVYVPHPIFVDREWPVQYLADIMNGGRNGATGGSRTSVFGAREHNLLGMTWYYNAGFAPNLWKRWLGLKVNNDGGEQFELTVDESKTGDAVNQMKGGEGRMCLPPMLIHPVKSIDLPVERTGEEEGAEEVVESDPNA
ncbi:hypothetical protein F5884DRAFT_364167 [Xylogone sp. PMI_703]|nr:hypothetical protein F5884DRAFT_364167 [Xylogone sp. PMI_703]